MNIIILNNIRSDLTLIRQVKNDSDLREVLRMYTKKNEFETVASHYPLRVMGESENVSGVCF